MLTRRLDPNHPKGRWRLSVIALLIVGCDGETAPGGSETQTTPTGTTATGTARTPASGLEIDRSPIGGAAAGLWVPLGEPGVGGWSTTVAVDPRDRDEWYVGGDQLGLAVSYDAGGSWCPYGCYGITGSNSIEDFTFHPTDNVVWVATSSGPFKSTDDGRTWQWKRDGMTPAINPSQITVSIQTIQFDPNDANRLVAFAGNQRRNQYQIVLGAGASNNIGTVWESTDGGENWIQLSMVTGVRDNVSSGTFLAGSSTDLLAAVENKGIWRSTDGGGSWSQTSAGIGDGYDVVAHPTQAGVAWATGGSPNVVLKTTDGGASWQQVATGQVGYIGHDAASDIAISADGSTLYFASKWGPISKSTDGGDSFQHLWTGTSNVTGVNVFGANLMTDVAVDPSDANRALAAGVNEIIATDDGGGTWYDAVTRLTSTGDFVGHGYSGLVCKDISFSPLTPGDLTLQTMDNGRGLTSKDGGASWFRPSTSPLSGGVETAHSATDPNLRYSIYGQLGWFGGLGISTDAGSSWTIVSTGAGLPAIPGAPNYDGAQWTTGLAVNPVDDQQVFAVIDQQIYRSTNGGGSFAIMGSGYVDVAFDDAGVLYAAGPAGVAQATDPAGGSLSVIPGGPSPTHVKWSQLHVSSGANPVVYVAAWGLGGYRYEDGGWTQLSNHDRVIQFATHPDDPDIVVAVSGEEAFMGDTITAAGVEISFDGGETFETFNDGLRLTRVTAVAFDPHDTDTLVIGTHSGGFFQTSFAALTDPQR